jgi:hypothetical protein
MLGFLIFFGSFDIKTKKKKKKNSNGSTRLPQTQTLYFRIVFVSGSQVVSKIDNPKLDVEQFLFYFKILLLFMNRNSLIGSL